MKISFERRLILFFVFIFLGIIVLGYVAYRNSRTTLETGRLITHNKEVIAESELILSLSKDIVMGSQRYVLTGDSAFLGHFPTSRDSVYVHISKLKDLTHDNAVQNQRVDSLYFLMKNRIDFSDLYIKIRNEDGLTAASKLIATGRGKFYIDEIRRLIAEIEGEEDFLLIERQKENNYSIANFNRAFYGLLSSVFIFLVVVFLYILENSKKRAKAAELLRQSEEQIQTIFRGAPDAVVAIDREGMVVNWNPKAETLFGWKEKEVLGKPLSETIIPHRYREAHKKGMEHFLKTGQGPVLGKTIEIQAINKSNFEFEVALSISPTVIESGYLFIGFIRDITMQKKADEELKTSRENFRRLFEYAPYPMWVYDLETLRFLEVNSTTVKQYGYSREELLNMHLADIRPQEQIPRLMESIKTRNEQDLLSSAGWKHKRRNGQVIDVEITSQLFNYSGRKAALVIAIDVTERKKTEDEIRETNVFLDTILENIPNMIFVKDADELRFIRFNKAGEKLLGYSRKDLIGKNDYDFFPKEQADFFTNKDRDVLKKGDLLDIPEEPIDTTAGKRFLHTQKIPVLDENGKPLYLLGISEDITERKIAERNLKELNERFIKIFNLSPVAMSICHMDDGHFVVINETFEKLFLVKNAEAEGKTSVELKIADAELRRETVKHLEEEKGHIRTEEVRLRKTNGEVMDMLASLETIEFDNTTCILMAFVDITERKKVEERLKVLNERFLKIFNLSPVAMSISNIDDAIIVQANEAFEKMFLITRDEAIGKSFAELQIRTDDRGALLKYLEKQGGSAFGLEMKLRKTTGQFLDALVSIEMIDFNDKKCLLSAAMDITRRKEAEEEITHLNAELKKHVEQLQAVNKELEAFTYSVSHDLRAPLRIISGYAEIILQDSKAQMDTETQKNLDVIKQNAQKMGQLIDDLLDLSRLGRKELVMHKVNMDEVVTTVIDEQESLFEGFHAEIKRETLLPANCDKNLITLVWSNLLSNAIKYSAGMEKPEITIGSFHKEEEVIYFIKDNGVGFDMKYADKLFGVFQRLHKMTEFEGTGVGLAVVQRIVLKHGGRVWAEAEVDKGATFYFSLLAYNV